MSETKRLNQLVQPLVAPARAGDRSAFDRLVKICRRWVYRWALSGTGDVDDADEVTQLVLIRLGRAIAGYRGDSLFTTWLYRLTGNVITDFHRGRSRRVKLAQKQIAQRPREGATSHAQPDEAQLENIHNADVVRLIHFFFEKLPDRQREIFDLVDLQGFAPAEVSRMIGMNGATVRAHLFKARRTIRRKIITEVPALAEELTNDV